MGSLTLGYLAVLLFLAYPLVARLPRRILCPSTRVRCAQCRYDLRGNPRSSRCPECGVDATGAQAIIARRLRRAAFVDRWLAITLTFVLVGLMSARPVV
jgi:hypothetical protein